MRLKMIVFAVAAFCFLAMPSFAASIDGTWVADMPARKMGGGPGGGGPGGGQQGPRQLVFKLKANGSKLTGTMKGPRGPENKIVDGKIDGNKVSFAIAIKMQNNEMKIKYEGTLSGDELTLNMSFEGGMGGGGGGGMQRPPIIAKRQK